MNSLSAVLRRSDKKTATSKNLVGFVPSKHGCDIIKTNMSSNNVRRNEQQNLLLSTTYGLNSSHTKKIHVGLQGMNEGRFLPIVKLTGNYVDGICFDIGTWQQFRAYIDDIEQYLSENKKTRPSPIIVNNISINFTSAHGVKTMLVAYKQKIQNILRRVGMSMTNRKTVTDHHL